MAAIRDELTEVEFDGRRGWTLGAVEPVPGFRLLPMFDNYLLGYRDRTAMLDPARHPRCTSAASSRPRSCATAG